ncbi:MAG TPA: translation initiation factor IF-1 [Nitrospirota bacterium]|nr:translation initiation factor IF-1 [Nitrospirota bacterium]
MSKGDFIETEGKILEAFHGGLFSVELDTGQKILAHLAGKMVIHHVRIVTGDRVRVELSVYDLTRGRITYRLKHEAA